MNEITILDAIERYIRGEMEPEERVYFEQLRKTNPSVDQMVVEHTIFLNQMNQYSETKDMKARLHDIHNALVDSGEIHEERPAIVVALWRRYKRVVGVAAVIAGVVAMSISSVVSFVSSHKIDKSVEIDRLNRRLTRQEQEVQSLSVRLDSNNNTVITVDPRHFRSAGTGFLIDQKGYLVTNAHVVKGATRIEVQNNLGKFRARQVYINDTTDLAILKIEDISFKSQSLPYGISKTGTELGEEIFTLGYPRSEIVYGKGYMSARTGYNGDTLTYQITVPANPGNSGTPVLNKDGEVVGIIEGNQHDAQDFVFAVRSRNLFQALSQIRNDSTLLKNDSAMSHIRLPLTSSLKGLDREKQIQKIQDCIFIVRR